MRSTNVVVYWNPAVSNYSLIVALTASLSALLYCALNSGDIWIDTRARCCIKVCLQRLNWTETNSWTRVFQCGSVHSARTDWAPTDLVSLQPIKSWRRSARPMNASYNRVDLLQVSSVQLVCCEQAWTGRGGQLKHERTEVHTVGSMFATWDRHSFQPDREFAQSGYVKLDHAGPCRPGQLSL